MSHRGSVHYLLSSLLAVLIGTASGSGAEDNPPPTFPEVAPAEPTATLESGPEKETLFVEEGEALPIPVIVTATSVPVNLDTSGNAVTVISGAHIEAKNAVLLEQSLREVPGISFGATGLLGKGPRSLYMRGTEADHTLVLIDGHKITPTNTFGVFDWDSIAAENVERIEVWRGAGSALYGTDAVAGVINIITKKGTGPDEAALSIEVGSQRFSRVRLGASGSTPTAGYSVSLTRIDLTDPDFDATKGSAGFNSDYHNTTFAANAWVRVNDRTKVEIIFRQYDDESGQSTDSAGRYVDPNDTNVEDAALLGITATHQLSDQAEIVIRYSRFNEEIQFISRDNASGAVSSIFALMDERALFTIHGNYTTESTDLRNTVTTGFSFEHESAATASSEQSRDHRAFFVQDRLEYREGSHLDVGVRRETSGLYADTITFRAAASQRLGALPTRLKASVGTGVREASFAESLGSAFNDGNHDLDPETNLSLDLGIEHRFEAARVRVSATAFRNSVDNFVQFLPTAAVPDGIPDYINAGEAEMLGLELELVAKPHPMLSVRGSLTVLDTNVTKNIGNPTPQFQENFPLLHRPDITASLSVNCRPVKAVTVQATVYYVGERDDADWSAVDWVTVFQETRVVNDPYARVDLSASWQVLPKLRVFGRVQNLFDKDYEDVFGFESPGIMAFAGVEYRQAF